MRDLSEGKKSWQGAAVAGVGPTALAMALLLAVPGTADADSAMAGDAERPYDAGGSSDDPLEPVNRSFSEVNRFLRAVLIDPMVDGYQAIAPEPVQEAVSNAVSNLTEPVTAVSSLLQGDGDNAATATSRFLVNTTVGLGGTGDPATDMGLEQRREDLGQAMGAHGIEGGPPLVLPLIGPTNVRDAVGDAVTALTSPLPMAATVGSEAVTYADNQEDIQALEEDALDPYIAEREAYKQYREYQVENGAGALPEGPSFADDPAFDTVSESASRP